MHKIVYAYLELTQEKYFKPFISMLPLRFKVSGLLDSGLQQLHKLPYTAMLLSSVRIYFDPSCAGFCAVAVSSVCDQQLVVDHLN